MSLMRTRALLCALALFVLSVPLVGAAPAARADTGATTVSGNWQPWIPAATTTLDPDTGQPVYQGAYDTNRTPSVTVERTTGLTDQVIRVSWKNFTPSSNDPQYVDASRNGPTARPSWMQQGLLYGVRVLQCRGASPTINPSTIPQGDRRQECYNAPVFPNPDGTDGGSGPNNAIYSVTQNDGTGSVEFHVENAISNDLLKCSPAQPCSIVVVPNQGGNSGLDKLGTACDDHSQDFVQPPSYDQFNSAQTDYDLSACSWSKRIAVPLSFAPLPGSCPAGTTQFTVVGSPALRRGLNQLLSGWCRGSDAVNFDYNSTSNEYLARNRFLAGTSGALTSSTDVALVSQPADAGAGGRPFVYAPIANDAVTIPYAIDNPKTGLPITDLRLTARLAAKLLTQSYNPVIWDCGVLMADGKRYPNCAVNVIGNPQSIFDDPEFQQLNFRGSHPDRASFPRTSDQGNLQVNGSFFPTVAAGDSDLTFALTRWIASDPDARAFLAGKRDAWGMHINAKYQITAAQRAAGQTLYPTSQFQALDPGWSAPAKPAPLLSFDPRTVQGFQGSWNPLGSLSQVTSTILGNRSTATSRDGVCATGNAEDCASTKGSIPIVFKKLAAEPFGTRGLTAVTDNTDAQAIRLPTAELVSRSGAAVGPTTAAMARAVASMRTNADKVTQYLDYRTVAKNAYPVMLPVYAMVPTCGLTTAKATAIKSMLGHVTGSQTYGLNPGELAPGLLALTADQLAKTRAARAAVSSAPCPAPRSLGTGQAPPRNAGTGTGTGSGPGTNNAPAPRVAPASAPAATPGPAATSRTPATSAPAPSTSASTRNVGYPLTDGSGTLPVLPVLLIAGAVALLASPLLWWWSGTGAGQAALARLRPRR